MLRTSTLALLASTAFFRSCFCHPVPFFYSPPLFIFAALAAICPYLFHSEGTSQLTGVGRHHPSPLAAMVVARHVAKTYADQMNTPPLDSIVPRPARAASHGCRPQRTQHRLLAARVRHLGPLIPTWCTYTFRTIRSVPTGNARHDSSFWAILIYRSALISRSTLLSEFFQQMQSVAYFSFLHFSSVILSLTSWIANLFSQSISFSSGQGGDPLRGTPCHDLEQVLALIDFTLSF